MSNVTYRFEGDTGIGTLPDGRVTECSDDDILRFIEKIEIGWQTVKVTFKAGISMELPREA